MALSEFPPQWESSLRSLIRAGLLANRLGCMWELLKAPKFVNVANVWMVLRWNPEMISD